MSDNEGITREEFGELSKRLGDVAAAVEDLKKASTQAEKREAREDVESAEKSLQRYADAHGISVSDAEEAIAQVKRNDQKKQFRSILEEIFAEDEARAAEEEAKAKAEKEEKKTGKIKAVETAKNKNVDTEPEEVHWTEKTLFGGGK